MLNCAAAEAARTARRACEEALSDMIVTLGPENLVVRSNIHSALDRRARFALPK